MDFAPCYIFQSKFSKNMMNHCIAGKCRKSSVTERQGEQRPIGGSHYFLLPGEPAYTTHLREGRSGMELGPNLCRNAKCISVCRGEFTRQWLCSYISLVQPSVAAYVCQTAECLQEVGDEERYFFNFSLRAARTKRL